MKEELIRLKELRERMERLKVRKQAAYDNYLLQHDELFKSINSAEILLGQAADNIRAMALEQYKETGEKKLDYGVGIRVLKKLEYEEAAALSWAKEHGLALSLNKSAFEKVARADPMDFVKINEIPQAKIPFKIEVSSDE